MRWLPEDITMPAAGQRREPPGGNLSEDQVLLATDGPIATVTLDQRTRHNAINQSMWIRLIDLFNEFQRDESVRVIVLRGAGERAFSAGADISEFSESRSNAQQASRYNALVAGAMDAAYNLSKPVVAQIHGYCLGGGCELASCCDLRYCDRESLFGVPMVKLGIGMGLDEIGRFVRLVGPANANEILQLGRRITAQRALEMGLINGVLDRGELEGYVAGVARELAENAPLSVGFGKRAIRLAAENADPGRIADRDSMGDGLFDTEDAREGVRAFLEKRAPRFAGR